MKNLVERIEKLWCENMHQAVMWPIHGHYRCSTCMREYAVEFEGLTAPPVEDWRTLTKSEAVN